MPARQAIADGVLTQEGSVLDFGAGRGLDVTRLREQGFEATGWDPYYGGCTDLAEPRTTVLLLYVLNVIEDPLEREATLRQAWALAGDALVVSARLVWDSRRVSGTGLADGVVTTRGTFQRLFTTDELRGLVEDVTGAKCFVAVPGVVYAFRSDRRRMATLAKRAMPVIDWAAARSAAEALSHVVRFYEARGRAPLPEELPSDCRQFLATAPWGSVLRQAQRAVRPELVVDGAKRSTLDTLLFLGLEVFHGRTSFSALPPAVAENIRRFFTSYREARARADRLLLKLRDDTYLRGAMANSVGKLTPSALYVERHAIARMPVILRLYEHCASVAAGRPASFDLIRLGHRGRTVSWLGYSDFERDPHPKADWDYQVDLRSLQTSFVCYQGRGDRPIIHRKEEFLAPDDHRVAKWARLTAAERRAGLYRDPQRIGTVAGWQSELDRCGVALRGHRLVRSVPR